jgi:hypothetical protein
MYVPRGAFATLSGQPLRGLAKEQCGGGGGPSAACINGHEPSHIVMTANLTPRKCLGFKTPLQAILKELGQDVQIRVA